VPLEAPVGDSQQLKSASRPSKDILVRGTLNLETTVPIASFPVDYEPVHYRNFELGSNPSGGSFNIASALQLRSQESEFRIPDGQTPKRRYADTPSATSPFLPPGASPLLSCLLPVCSSR
jgi:hypothetical protein